MPPEPPDFSVHATEIWKPVTKIPGAALIQ